MGDSGVFPLTVDAVYSFLAILKHLRDDLETDTGKIVSPGPIVVGLEVGVPVRTLAPAFNFVVSGDSIQYIVDSPESLALFPADFNMLKGAVEDLVRAGSENNSYHVQPSVREVPVDASFVLDWDALTAFLAIHKFFREEIGTENYGIWVPTPIVFAIGVKPETQSLATRYGFVAVNESIQYFVSTTQQFEEFARALNLLEAAIIHMIRAQDAMYKAGKFL